MMIRLGFILWLASVSVVSAGSNLDAYLKQVGLSGEASIVLMDARTGKVIEAVNARKSLPPASVTKAITVPYALRALGSEFRFQTRLIATGPIKGGVLQGDLVLQGGGDPLLDTDGLFKMATALRERGVQRITGAFLFADGAISNVSHLDEEQPEWVGYNPALSGLNLNFNRVYFEWKGSTLSLTAKGENHAPPVDGVKIAITDQAAPVFKHGTSGESEVWTVARPALGNGGSRWLPVRDPGAYAAEVFRTLAADAGVTLPEPARANGDFEGQVLVSESGADLVALGRGMLKFSTNLSAEIVGMRASAAKGKIPADHHASAKSMTDWAKREYKVTAISFRDHSGLSDASKASALSLSKIMLYEAKTGLYPALLKPIPIEGPSTVTVRAKTGTLNFVSTLSGIIEGPRGQFAFAILLADVDRRREGKRLGHERPAGSRTWIRLARNTQKAILVHWAEQYVQ